MDFSIPQLPLFKTFEESFKLVSVKLINLLLPTDGYNNLLLERLDVGDDATDTVQTNNLEYPSILGIGFHDTQFKSIPFGIKERPEKLCEKICWKRSANNALKEIFTHVRVEYFHPVVNSLALGALNGKLILHSYKSIKS